MTPSCRRHDGLIAILGIECEVVSDMQLRIVNVTLVMTDGPFCGLLGTDGIGPPESHDARTDSDAKPSGFGFGVSAPRPTSPRCCWFEQCRSRGDRLGAREPQPQRVDRPQFPGRDPVAESAADIFGTYDKPAGPGRVDAGAPGDVQPTAVALAPCGLGGLGRSRLPVNRGTDRTAPE
ncbi:hypothetical protein MELE44368_24120 [Mycolicibacterium elephantis DSM 44368]|uniref:Uncharacterized protein n=1 Tax=Mycolicibacterium elephantis DSM 44368 TaxID=1335622 RepID=A0A439DQN9_9MYCO|nr:hypothetical protein MELE44368_24120 [Mycolicibacterium elephantis DSM 44368]